MSNTPNDFSREAAINAFYQIRGKDSLHVVPLMVSFLACMYDDSLEETFYVKSDVPVRREDFMDPEFHIYIKNILIQTASQAGVTVKDKSSVIVFNSILHPEEANMFKNKPNNT